MALKLSRRTDFRSSGPVGELRVLNALLRDKKADGSFTDLGGDQVAYTPPIHVHESVHAALNEGRTGYTEAIGTPAIRNAVGDFYAQEYDLDITGARVAVTTGAAGALVLALLCFFSPGQRVGVTVPGLPEHRRALQALGLEPVDIPVTAEGDFQVTPELLQTLAGGVDGLILTNPANPSGSVMDGDALADIARWCAENGVRLLVDETGHGLTYNGDGALATILSHTDDAVVIGSFSRRFAMPGWRMGWLVLPGDNVRTIECLAQSLTVSPPTLPQFAGVEALAHRAELDEDIALLGRNRDLAVAKLTAAGFTVEGGGKAGLYLWLRLPDDTPDSMEFCTGLLRATGIYLRPGVEFDAAGGHRHVRLSFGLAADDFSAAIDGLLRWMEG